MSLKKLFIILAVYFVLQPGMPALADSPTVGDISQELICQCGCTLTVANCTHIECMSRDAMVTAIKDKLDQGQSEEAIIQFFVAQYGEQVLASPPKQGFNLVVWILPFAGILGGIIIIYIAIKKWVKQGKRPQSSTPTKDDESDEEYRKRLEKELSDFTEGGFR